MLLHDSAVADYCHSCPECQKVARKTGQRVPMIPLSIMGEPFESIAMDIVGPLPRIIKRYKYILVVCDYVTRYPEAIPLKKFTVVSVVEELISLFARCGVPKEILTEQGTNFTSQLLQVLYKLLGVKPIRTTPYLPQTDGLVERFSKTLNGLLWRIVQGEGWEWEKYLPYVLFFLLWGIAGINGILSIWTHLWTRCSRTLGYTKRRMEQCRGTSRWHHDLCNQGRERMEAARKIVIPNMKKSQNKQKEWIT